jgi:hypothetical protein
MASSATIGLCRVMASSATIGLCRVMASVVGRWLVGRFLPWRRAFLS